MNILLVEDDGYSREYLTNFLQDLGHQVVECENGLEALEAFKSREFHMVLSDIKMPKMSGIELLREIKAINSEHEAEIILFTGHGDLQSAIEALRAGAYDYLLKPINIKELAIVVERVSQHLALKRDNKVLTESFNEEVKSATEDTRKELSRLRKAYATVVGVGDIEVFSDSMSQVFRQAAKYHADRSVPVLIQGETGTGKEVLARYIHYGNAEVVEPFIDINCAALNPSIFESELFGYEAGAFTGGVSRGQKGKFDLAQGGTIFLDEISELPDGLQAKLLRVLQEKEFYRVGGLKKIKTDVRIICATNADIERYVEEGRFRRDLYYRLNVGRLFLPPLRERKEDILPLAKTFLKNYARKSKKRFRNIPNETAQVLLSYSWRGNVRELKNTMEWVALMHDNVELKPNHLGILKSTNYIGSNVPEQLPISIRDETIDFSLPPDSFDLKKFEQKIVLKAMEIYNGNKAKTARYLGISRRILYGYIDKIGKN